MHMNAMKTINPLQRTLTCSFHTFLYIYIYIYHYTLTHSNESGWHVPLEDSFPLQLEVFHVHVSELKRLFEGA